MSLKSVSETQFKGAVSADDHSPPLKALAIGDTAEWQKEGNFAPLEGMAFLAFQDINEEVLGYLCPSVVYSPLLAKTFDCIELAILLAKLGFSGQYRAFARDLPKPDVIEREVRQLCPGLDFRIVDKV